MNFSEVVKKNLEKGILLSPDLLNEEFEELPQNTLVVNKDTIKLSSSSKNTNWSAFEKARVLWEKNVDTETYKEFITEKNEKGVEVLFSYNKPSVKRSYADFVAYFNARFQTISGMLRNRSELQRLTSISKVISKKDKSNVAVIGMIYEKTITKNGNILMTLEDKTGYIKVLVSNKKQDMFKIAKDSCLDEVVGVEGTYDNILFANSFIIPDVPRTKELKKSPEEEYVIFIGDPQVGSKHFLEKDFLKMISWLQGKIGNDEQKRVASKVKYAIIPGDLVEGVGVYPNQENDLSIFDIKEQYDKFAEYMQEIPEHIQIIVCPGNHDAGRLAEPQPLLYKDFAESVWKMPNVTIVSNPALFTIGKSDSFPGFDVLVYHGGSMFYYASEIESIRSKGGILKGDLIMKYYLQRRHLAPTHTSTVYVPDPDEDPLVITKVPDFFVTGHVHLVFAENYRNTSLINASAWTGITENQIRRGLEPQPSRLPIVNLKTREVKIMNFLGKEEAERIKAAGISK